MPSINPIPGTYSQEENGWLSDIVTLTGDAYLEVSLPQKGRIVIKKAETIDGPYPKALVTPWAGPDFRIRIRHGRSIPPPQNPPGDQGHNRYIRIVTTETPTTINLVNI